MTRSNCNRIRFGVFTRGSVSFVDLWETNRHVVMVLRRTGHYCIHVTVIVYYLLDMLVVGKLMQRWLAGWVCIYHLSFNN